MSASLIPPVSDPAQADRPAAATRTVIPSGAAAKEAERLYLLVLQGESSSLFHLPYNGVITIGRVPEVELQLEDGATSRRHAKLVIADGEVRVMDLESHNGTRVNGERITEARLLVSGDVIAIGSANLVLHGTRSAGARPLLDSGQLRRRLEEEVQRALEYERPLTVLALALRGAARAELPRGFNDRLRMMDVAGWSADTLLVILLPEYGPEEARASAEPLIEALSSMAPEATAGFASLPEDGCDADTLLASARAAAFGAGRGQAAAAAESAVHRIQLADRTILVADPAMLRLYELLKRLAGADLPVLILGETGAGKENAAFSVHHWSPRSQKPFVTVNCAAIHESLVESELFGHEKGAFTGAVASKAGLFETADGGTVFLDEIGELSPAVQAKLLRALETKKISRVGEVRERPVELRVVAATNRNLPEEVKAGRFRQDLYFRLSAATVILPPLRDRPREIPVLARAFLEQACARLGREQMTISAAAMQQLTMNRWEGNIRELRNMMEYVAAATAEPVLEPWLLQDRTRAASAAAPGGAAEAPLTPGAKPFRRLGDEIKELEKKRMEEALAAAGGVQVRAAELIGVPLRTFVQKLKQYGLGRTARREG